MQILKPLAATACLVNAATMTLGALSGDVSTFTVAYVNAASTGYVWLYLREDAANVMTFRELAMRLRWEIKEEGWEVGAALPPRRRIARRFDTSNATVDRALRLLAEEGLVTLRARKGAYVAGGGTNIGRRAYLVEQHIRSHIAQGQRIAPADEIAQSWSVSPSTVRRVCTRLIREGVLRRRRDGSYEGKP